MKRFFTALVLIFCFHFIYAQQEQLIKKSDRTGFFHWTIRSISCNTSCITGDCDKGEICTDPDPFQIAYAKNTIENGFYIKDRAFYLKAGYKKYFLGNNGDARNLQLLQDNNDRVIIYLVGRPELLDPQSKTPDAPVLKIITQPLSLKSITVEGDLKLAKLPQNFPASFEIGIQSERYCNRQGCNIWTPYNRAYTLKKEMAAQKYEVMPILIDTISDETHLPYSVRKNLTIQVPFPKDKRSFTTAEIRNLLDALNEPPYTVRNIEITTNPSMELDSAAGIVHQRRLAESFVNNLSVLSFANGLRSKVKVTDAWTEFKKQIVLTNWFYLADSSSKAVRKKLNKDKWLNRSLTPLLQDLSMATIVLDVEFDPKVYPEPAYWHYKLSHAVQKKDTRLALSYQKELIRLHKLGKVTTAQLITSNVPENPLYLPLLNNQCAFLPTLKAQNDCLERLVEVDPNNPLVKYNLLAVKLNLIRFSPEDSVREAMLGYTTLFTTVNATSIPKSLYDILQSRFYLILNEAKRDRKLQSYTQIQNLVKAIPADEAAKFADDYARIRRYDIAVSILLEHYYQIRADNKNLLIQYALRILYYGKYAGEAFEKQSSLFIDALGKIQQADQHLFVRLFDEHQLAYLFLADKEARKLYLEAKKGNW